MASVALVMIARNEERCIARALKSVKPFVDEMIVVDTGSTDHTVDIASECGATVGHFEWCDDFAAAKNAALDLSTSDWNLVLDADEWILSGGEFLRSLPDPDGQAFGISVENHMEGDPPYTVMSSAWRLATSVARYTGTVHEQLTGWTTVEHSPIVLGHDGYQSLAKSGKKDRNITLLREALKADPENAYYKYQLGHELVLRKRWGGAVKVLREALAMKADASGWDRPAVTQLLWCLVELGWLEEAASLMEEYGQRWPTSSSFLFHSGQVFMRMWEERPELARQLLPLAETAWRRCLEVGEEPNVEGAIVGQGSHLAAEALAQLYRTGGDRELAVQYRELAQRLRKHAVLVPS